MLVQLRLIRSLLPGLDFSPLTYIASAIGAVLAGQLIVWFYPQSNVYTALIASAIGWVVDGIALQVMFFVIPFQNALDNRDTGLIGVPWLIFTLFIVGLLLFLESKSLCIPQHCRFLLGLLIPVLGIAVFGKVAGASAALGTAFNEFPFGTRLYFLPAVLIHFPIDPCEFHHSSGGILCNPASIQVHLLSRLSPLKHRIHRCRLCRKSVRAY